MATGLAKAKVAADAVEAVRARASEQVTGTAAQAGATEAVPAGRPPARRRLVAPGPVRVLVKGLPPVGGIKVPLAETIIIVSAGERELLAVPAAALQGVALPVAAVAAAARQARSAVREENLPRPVRRPARGRGRSMRR